MVYGSPKTAASLVISSQVEGAQKSTHVSRGISLLNGDQDHSKFEMLHHLDKDAETDQLHKSLVGGKGEGGLPGSQPSELPGRIAA